MEFAASLIAIVGLADKVISRSQRFISAIKDCPSDLRSILIETSSIKSVVQNLEFLYENSANIEYKQYLLSLHGETGPVHGCRACLQELERLLPKEEARSDRGKRRSIQPTLERLAWPLHQSKAVKLLADLQRFKGAISGALIVELSATVQSIHSRVEQIFHDLDNESRDKALEWLVTTDPSQLHRTTCDLREEHTGLWLSKCPEYLNWRDKACPSVWMHGIPGAGKTVLFSHIVDSDGIRSDRFSSDPTSDLTAIFDA